MADNVPALGLTSGDPGNASDWMRFPDSLIRILYHIGDQMLVQTAARERQPLMLRYMLSRLKRVAQRYVGYVEAQRLQPGAAADMAEPRIWKVASALDAAAESSGRSVSKPLTFLYICALEGLLDEPQRADNLDAAALTVRYLTTDVTLAELGGQAHKSPGDVSGLISAAIIHLWDALPPDASETFPFDRSTDFPLLDLRHFRALKRSAVTSAPQPRI